MIDKLTAIYSRYEQLEEQLGNPDLVSDLSRYKKVNKEYKDLKPLIECYLIYADIIGNINTSQEMLKDNDFDMRQMAHEELSVLLPQKLALEEQIKMLLIPKDPADSKNVILEIRSGTGGDEAAIFASDLFRMYSRYMENKGWKTEVLDVTEGVLGGYSKIVLEIQGDEVYGHLKFESGAHRVQRVPKTESQGRVHTSAATVAIIPVWEDEEININRADLKIDTFRASGAGGQHVNKTESAVRIVHKPTGLEVKCQDQRSQHKNYEQAMRVLRSRVLEMMMKKAHDERSAARKEQIGSGDRSERIRTYNFPQNRFTDHRINLNIYRLDAIMLGELGDVFMALREQDRKIRLQQAKLT